MEMPGELPPQPPDVFDLILARLNIGLVDPAVRTAVADTSDCQGQQVLVVTRHQEHLMPVDQH